MGSEKPVLAELHTDRFTLDNWKCYLDSCATYHTFFVREFLDNSEAVPHPTSADTKNTVPLDMGSEKPVLSELHTDRFTLDNWKHYLDRCATYHTFFENVTRKGIPLTNTTSSVIVTILCNL